MLASSALLASPTRAPSQLRLPCLRRYDLLDRNCHHWSDTAAAALGVAAIPRWVDRTARCLGQLRGMPAEGPDGPYDENSDGSDGGASPCGRHASDSIGGYCSMGADFIHMRSKPPAGTPQCEGECVPLMSRGAQLDEGDDAVLEPPRTPGALAARGAAGGALDARPSPVSAPPSMTRNARNSV